MLDLERSCSMGPEMMHYCCVHHCRPAPNKRYNSSYGYADALKTSNIGSAGFTAVRGAAAAAVNGLGQRFA